MLISNNPKNEKNKNLLKIALRRIKYMELTKVVKDTYTETTKHCRMKSKKIQIKTSHVQMLEDLILVRCLLPQTIYRLNAIPIKI